MYFKPFIMRTMNAIQSKKCRNMSHLYFTIIRFVVQSKYQHTKLAKVHSQWFFRLIPKMLSARIFPTAREKGLTQKRQTFFWRRTRDSNSRAALATYSLSRGASSPLE